MLTGEVSGRSGRGLLVAFGAAGLLWALLIEGVNWAFG